MSLADYRGRVVLLNFWYPSCGPCRGEFPALQRVLDKYKDRGFAILSLNVLPDEKAFVMPYLTKNRFTFHALETDTDWAERTFGARGFPTNLPIDGDGRIMFRPGIIRSPRDQRTFELQIEALLAHASSRRRRSYLTNRRSQYASERPQASHAPARLSRRSRASARPP